MTSYRHPRVAPRLALVLQAPAIVVFVLAASAHATVVVLPDITVTSLGHSHFSDLFFGGSYTQDGVSFGTNTFGSFQADSFTGEALAGDTIRQNILAEAGGMFSVNYNPALNFDEVFGVNV